MTIRPCDGAEIDARRQPNVKSAIAQNTGAFIIERFIRVRVHRKLFPDH